MIEFKLTQHQIRSNCPIVEVWENNRFVATITPGSGSGSCLHLCSSHFLAFGMDTEAAMIVIPDSAPHVFRFYTSIPKGTQLDATEPN